jgi:thiamine pyrophosphokinase
LKAVVVAHGEVDPADAAHARAADLLIAADGGTLHLEAWGIEPRIVVGDLDSLPPDARARLATRIERHPAEKDKSDTELAVERAIAAGADEVVVLGALGGPRADHALANTFLLAVDHGGARVRVVRGPLSIRIVRGGGRADLSGAAGELVTLLAIGGDAGGVRTEGLRYPLRSETLRLGSSRGVSNEISAAGARVSVGSGMLLVIEGGALSSQGAPPPASPGSPAHPQPKA